MSSPYVINIARDYARWPVGRYVTDGPYSGERFREEMLFPALKLHQQVSVELDGTIGHGSSFLEEAFAGLLRGGCNMSADEVERKLILVSKNEKLKETIKKYIKDEIARKRQ